MVAVTTLIWFIAGVAGGLAGAFYGVGSSVRPWLGWEEFLFILLITLVASQNIRSIILVGLGTGVALAATIATLLLTSTSSFVLAQQDDEYSDVVFEEVIVTGRFISSSQQLVNERTNDAFSTDLLGADTRQLIAEAREHERAVRARQETRQIEDDEAVQAALREHGAPQALEALESRRPYR